MKIRDYIFYPLIFFIFWRVFLLVIAFISPQVMPEFKASFPYYNERLVSTGLPSTVWSFGNFDGVHYIGISQKGYSFQFTQAFFPLYPLLMSFLSKLTSVSTLIAGLLISNTAFLIGLIFFFKLVKENFDKKTAVWSIAFLASFPTSFYFGAVYTEGLFFMLTILTFYLASKKRYLIGSIFGLLAANTRLVGLFLTASCFNKKNANYLPLLIIPFGLLAYMFYLYMEFNNPLYFLTSQAAFGQERSTTGVVLLPQVIFRWLKQILSTEGLQLFNSVFELSTLALSLSLLVVAWKKQVSKDWIVFSCFAIITPTLTGSLASMPRYIVVAFPIYIVLAQIKNKYVKIFILFLFGLGLTFCTTMFTRGYWIA